MTREERKAVFRVARARKAVAALTEEERKTLLAEFIRPCACNQIVDLVEKVPAAGAGALIGAVVGIGLSALGRDKPVQRMPYFLPRVVTKKKCSSCHAGMHVTCEKNNCECECECRGF